MNKTYATLYYHGETIDTELTPDDCTWEMGYPVVSTSIGGEANQVTMLAHFQPFDDEATAGEIYPPDALRPANARLVWTWPNPEYADRIKAAFSVKEFPAGVL